MDPKVIFWTGAFVNMGVIFALAVAGVRQRRAGDLARHRRSMLVAGSLVVVFLVAYVVKVVMLGKEDLAAWSEADRWILWSHELCVATLLIAGGFAAWRGRSLGRTRNVTKNPADAPAPAPLGRQHRAAGWTAMVAVGLGFLSAAFVLLGMYQRSGIL